MDKIGKKWTKIDEIDKFGQNWTKKSKYFWAHF